jgi:hypothetical protein
LEQSIARIQATAASVRRARETTLVRHSQSEIVDALVELGQLWSDRQFRPRIRAEAIDRPFPFSMTRFSLEGLIESLQRDRLMDLLVNERVWRRWGHPVVGHIIAGNTPLLSWTSIIRALLVRSGSLVKLPAHDRGSASEWTRLLKQSLYAVKPSLGEFIGVVEWERGTPHGEEPYYKAFCDSSDMVVAYGADSTIEKLRSLCPDKPFLGYGHRLSFGLVLPSADIAACAEPLANDILLYDQGGCLSPQMIYVVGPTERSERMAAELARALDRMVIRYPLLERHPYAARRVRQAREVATMEGAKLWVDPGSRWTVVLRSPGSFYGSPTHGVVSVAPLLHDALLEGLLQPVTKYLQGCCIAGAPADVAAVQQRLSKLGASYLCAPGKLQAPPIDWPQDNIPVLNSLLPHEEPEAREARQVEEEPSPDDTQSGGAVVDAPRDEAVADDLLSEDEAIDADPLPTDEPVDADPLPQDENARINSLAGNEDDASPDEGETAMTVPAREDEMARVPLGQALPQREEASVSSG